MANNFSDPTTVGLVGLWDFRSGAEASDTGLADGGAQNGAFAGDASASGDQLRTDGNGDYFDVRGNRDTFDLPQGTLQVEFTQTAHVGSQPETIVSRGESDDASSEGYFGINALSNGSVQIIHVVDGNCITLTTDPGLFAPGDTVKATYSWDIDAGGSFIVENLSNPANAQTLTYTDTGLTMDLGDNDSENFTFGAREDDDGTYDSFFNGSIDYVAVFDRVVPPQDPDGIVEGTNDGELIDQDYMEDPEGDMVDAGDAIDPAADPDDDAIDAFGGNDTVLAGAGEDEVFAGSGNDSVEGGAGDDLLVGDGNLSDINGGVPRESFEWDLAGVPAGGNLGNFTQNTGTVDVAFSILNEEGSANSRFADNDQNIAGLVTDGAAADGNSSLASGLSGSGDSVTYALDFSESVSNVSFLVNDIDGDSIVSITAFDANGTPIPVNLTGGSRTSLSDTDSVPGADTAESDRTYGMDSDPGYAVLVGIPGPVARIVVEHTQDGDNNSGMNVTDVYFDAGVVDYEPGGSDTLIGGEGDDTIIGGEGADSLLGGDGADIFQSDPALNGGDMIGDFVDGGSGPSLAEDNDTLDLRGSAPDGGSLSVEVTGTDSNGNGVNGIVTYRDDTGTVVGTMTFEEIENIIPCFTPGTTIATPSGERLVEDLKAGDRIITRDNGIQQIRWVGSKTLDWEGLYKSPHLRPILIRAGSLGNDLPERDMMVSPNHRMLVAGNQTALYFEESEVLVAAKHLVDTAGICRMDVRNTTYVHFMFDNHEVVLANGAWTESFQPGDYSLKGIGDAQRSEILELFPELKTYKGLESYTSARKTLKRHEARLLAK